MDGCGGAGADAGGGEGAAAGKSLRLEPVFSPPFDFLGYRFEAGQRRVRPKSRQRLFDRIRDHTRRTRGDSLTRVIAELNPILRGWFNYFKHAHRMTFPIVDGFVRRRLRAMLRKQQKRPGAGHTRADHQRWPNAFFAAHGLFTLTEAHVAASQSR